MELPNIVDTLYSRNALQFPDLETAEKFLFFIHEDDRARITHLRFPVPDGWPRQFTANGTLIIRVIPGIIGMRF